ncbi:hypothetical protein [Halomonas litopenaei]|uniref:hypothetical protein n=1 Tax=Halomonas litopenaei TaxID=2109328 RepID=UPI001A8EB405|nr:hypothetical protein [Halomonas litopenaei]MBN8412138.1 hypothetical protein [Halomonas litopenaei]
MKEIYLKHLSESNDIHNHNDRLSYLTATLRSLLQLAVISTFEITKQKTPSDEVGLSELTTRFCKPSDGVPLQIIDILTPKIRGYLDNQYLQGWFEATKSIEKPLSKQLIEWVEFRNKRQGHGVIDTQLSQEWAEKTKEILLDCLEVFSPIIPTVDHNDDLILSKKFGSLKLETPLTYKKKAIVILSITARKGIWKLKGQVLSRNNAHEFTLTLDDENVFNSSGISSGSKYELAEVIVNDNSHTFFHNIPVRQTDTFEGRVDEINDLKEWFDDEDSRYCLVYGDGGYGKTTLVLEMLNRLLENEYDFNRTPPIIFSYHTAKMTRWTEGGLTYLTSISPIMDECLRELMRLFHPVLSKDWYTASGRELIDKVKTNLQSQKFTRDDVLLIIDNTETLATDSNEARDLGAFFKAVGKSIGRVIITSRRREFIEATPIVVGGLSEVESVNLMRRLAEEFHAKPILQAGESTLRKVSCQLMQKPILLEALVKYISRTDVGIDAAISNVFKKSSEELLEFLYEDAWARMTQLQSDVFLCLIHLSSPMDQSTIGKVCQEIGIQHTEFQSSLEETHFSIMSDYGRTYSIELVSLARRFFLNQFSKLDDTEKTRIKEIAGRVDEYAIEREKIEKEYKRDRVAEAFRSDYAKAAKIAAEKGEIRNAIEFYEMAVEDDPVNSALHDRFSWFLLNKANDYEYARRVSEKSVHLDENNCDAVVGLALVYYRLGDIKRGDARIDQAGKLGRAESFCLLRKAIARYYTFRNEIDYETKYSRLLQANELLDKAEKRNSRTHKGYDAKNLRDIRKYKDMVSRGLSSLRSQANRAKTHHFDLKS